MMNGVLLPSESDLNLGLIGNPENRRLTEFSRTLEALGQPSAETLSYLDMLQNFAALDRFSSSLVRIDSPGENQEVTDQLITLGGGPECPEMEFGEVAWLKAYHEGFLRVLGEIERRGLCCLNSPADIAVMFDKWGCHRKFSNAGVPRPQTFLAPTSSRELREKLSRRRSGQVFLKPLHGSSGSGVCAFRWMPGRETLISPITIRRDAGVDRLFNSLKIRSYSSSADVGAILDRLLPEGMVCETWIPKLTLSGGAIDIRILVVAGEARHWVVRQSKSPITNLHLGNERGSQDELAREIGATVLEEAFAVAEQAMKCFPDSLYAGVDVLITQRHEPIVCEVNAFGDLLPGLKHRGETAYESIANASLAQSILV